MQEGDEKDSRVSEHSREVLSTWRYNRLATRYISLYLIQRNHPELVEQTGRQIDTILDVLRKRPESERLDIYKRMGNIMSGHVAREEYEMAADLKKMRELFYCKVLA